MTLLGSGPAEQDIALQLLFPFPNYSIDGVSVTEASSVVGISAESAAGVASGVSTSMATGVTTDSTTGCSTGPVVDEITDWGTNLAACRESAAALLVDLVPVVWSADPVVTSRSEVRQFR